MEITTAQLENLEDGNVNAFKDIFFLKELIKKYAKYLNVNEDEVISEFNDFVFDYTSRIPVEDGKELILIDQHLSAYGTDAAQGNAQLEMLFADMKAEYDKGNYVICGGDFNHDFTR